MEVKRSMLVELPAERIFDIVEAAEHYPKFVPWCTGAVITERDDDIVGARITVEYKRLRFGFQTRNPKRRPQWLGVQLVEGPFRRFEGMWRFTPLSPSACKIEFGLRCELSDFFIGRLAVPVFNYVTDTLVDAFVRRAEQVHAAEVARAAAARVDGSLPATVPSDTTATVPSDTTSTLANPASGAPEPSRGAASTAIAPIPITPAPAANASSAPAPEPPAIVVPPPPAPAAADSPPPNPRPT